MRDFTFRLPGTRLRLRLESVHRDEDTPGTWAYSQPRKCNACKHIGAHHDEHFGNCRLCGCSGWKMNAKEQAAFDARWAKAMKQ